MNNTQPSISLSGLPSLEVLQIFLKEILKERSYVAVDNHVILTIVKLIDNEGRYYHVQDDAFLWNKADWIKNEANVLKRKRDAEEYRNRIYVIQDAIDAVWLGLCKQLHSTKDINTWTAAYQIVKDRNAGAANFFGFSGLENIPLLDKPHQFKNELDGVYYAIR